MRRRFWRSAFEDRWDGNVALALPEPVEHWSLTTLREKLVKIGARIVRHGRYVIFQLAEVAVPRGVFAGALDLINGLRGPPATTESA